MANPPSDQKTTRTTPTTTNGGGGIGGGGLSGGPSKAGSGVLKDDVRGMGYDAGQSWLSPGGGGATKTTPGKDTKGAKDSPNPSAKTGDPRVAGSDKNAGNDKKKMSNVMQDLGQVESMGEVNGALGTAIEGLAPGIGNAFEATFDIKVKGMLWYGKFKFKMGVKQTDAGFELSGSVGLAIGVELDAWVASASAEAYGNLGFTAKGDTGGECVNLISLGIYNWLSPQPINVANDPEGAAAQKISRLGGWAWFADEIFGDHFDEKVMATMEDETKGDEADVLEMSSELGIGGNVTLLPGDDEEVSAGLRGGYRTVGTLGKNKDGRLERKDQAAWVINLPASFTVKGHAVEVDLSAKYVLGKGWDIEVAVDAAFNGEDMAAFGASVWALYGNVVTTALGQLNGKESSKTIADLSRALMAVPYTAFMAACTANEALAKGMGLEAEAGLGVTVGYSDGKVKLEVDLFHSVSGEREADGALASVKAKGAVKTKSKLLEQSFDVGAALDVVKQAAEQKATAKPAAKPMTKPTAK